MISKKDKGQKGEGLAANYLISRGYEILEKNYRHHRQEIDLIAKQADCLVFVEVKTRFISTHDYQDTPLTTRQQLNLKKVLKNYFLTHQANFKRTRLDLILIIVNKLPNTTLIKHYRNI